MTRNAEKNGAKLDHTYYRAWTYDKFFLGFIGSYFILREVTILNLI